MSEEVFADYICPWPGMHYTSHNMHEGRELFVHAVQIASCPYNWVFLYTTQDTRPIGIFKIKRIHGSYLHYVQVD